MLIEYSKYQFINHNIFLGCMKFQTLESSYNYLMGFKKLNAIIKLSFSILFCKQLFLYLSQFFYKYGSLWVLFIIIQDYKIYKKNFINFMKKFNDFFIDYKFRIWFLITRLKPGALSNYNSWRQTYSQVFKYIWYPSSIFQINILFNSKLQFEPTNIGMIGININDTCIEKNINNYIIEGNEKNIMSLVFYYKILINFTIRIFLLQKIKFLKKYN